MHHKYEQKAFLAEMSHTDSEAHYSWRLRVGPSGNVNSFIGPFSEAIPPQKHAAGPWIDEVWQMVAVSQANQRQASVTGKSYFIHQAGTYQRDSTTIADPFYSPSIAKHCAGNTCYFASWGQHAHVPTPFHSRLLYYTRYADCGDGVLEVTYAMHHDATASETVEYLNVPWGGVRTTQLRDFLVSQPGGGPASQAALHTWGSAEEVGMIKNLNMLGGYTTFAEDLPNPEPPCVQGGTIHINHGGISQAFVSKFRFRLASPHAHPPPRPRGGASYVRRSKHTRRCPPLIRNRTAHVFPLFLCFSIAPRRAYKLPAGVSIRPVEERGNKMPSG